MKPLFLRLLLVDSLFGCFLALCAISLHHALPLPALVSIATTLVLYAAGAAAIARETLRVGSWGWEPSLRILSDVDWLAERLPGVAMLGTIAGFLADEHSTTVLTVLTSTFVGVACWQALGLQHRMVSREIEVP